MTDLERARRDREADELAREADQPHALLRAFCDGCGLRHGTGDPAVPSITVAPVAADWTALECPRCGCMRSTARLLRPEELDPPKPEPEPEPPAPLPVARVR